jgi:hypothetical protein
MAEEVEEEGEEEERGQENRARTANKGARGKRREE